MNKHIFNFIICSSNVFVINDSERERLQSLLCSEKIEWDEVIEVGMLHRILPSIYYKLNRLNLLQYIKQTEVKEKLEKEFQIAQEHNAAYFEEIGHVSKDFGPDVLLIKGEILAYAYYPHSATRPFGDCDMLCRQQYIEQVSKILKKNGFVQGYAEDGEIKYPSKRELMFARMYMKHLIAFVKYQKEYPFVFEPHYTLLWRGQNGKPAFPLEMEELFLDEKPIDFMGHAIYVMGNEDFLIYLCIDFYEDTNRISKLIHMEDLELIKILDIYAVINQGIDWEHFLSKVESWKMKKYMYYSLYYVNRLYKIVPETVLSYLQPDNLDYLNEFGFPEELKTSERGRYFTGFDERLFCGAKRKQELLEQLEKCRKTTFEVLRNEKNRERR